MARTGLLAFQRGPDVHFADKGHTTGLMQLEQVVRIRRNHTRQVFFPDALQFLERGLKAAFVLEDGDPVGEDRFLDGGQHFLGSETFLAQRSEQGLLAGSDFRVGQVALDFRQRLEQAGRVLTGHMDVVIRAKPPA